MTISILGAGAWGTALAVSLAPRHPVLLWARDAQAIEAMASTRSNARYLPGATLPDSLQLSADIDTAVAHARDGVLIVATSVAGLRPMLRTLKPMHVPNLVWLCKGFEQDSALLPHQIAAQELGDTVPVGALSGPSFATEVARGLPCALTIGSRDAHLRAQVVKAVHGANLRVYSTDDIIGVEVGGAVKNVLAIATGIADGLGLGMNARAALITRGLAEITRLGTALGGRSETFMGLTGMGDLILTCTGDLSRNRQVGLGLANGKTLEAIVTELGHVAEGVRCVQAVRQLARERGMAMPIIDAVAQVLFEHEKPQNAIQQLLAREAREEHSITPPAA
jgi:glycerol-3-phosphate dehydrogenase (NAD(P)+)